MPVNEINQPYHQFIATPVGRQGPQACGVFRVSLTGIFRSKHRAAIIHPAKHVGTFCGKVSFHGIESPFPFRGIVGKTGAGDRFLSEIHPYRRMPRNIEIDHTPGSYEEPHPKLIIIPSGNRFVPAAGSAQQIG